MEEKPEVKTESDRTQTRERARRLKWLLFVLPLAFIVLAAFWTWCDTTPVPAAGAPVPAAAIAVVGAPAAIGGGPIPAGAMCAGGAGDTSNAPGSRCWVFWRCTDTYHVTTGKCECRCL